MHTGMLWFDNSEKPLSEKLKKAIEYYQKKNGRLPDLCLVHPEDMGKGINPNDVSIVVRPYRPVLPGHIWIGIEEKAGDQ